jgi:hypothetical protein
MATWVVVHQCRVLPDAPTTATMQPLDLLEHVCTCLVVDFHPLGIPG